MTGATQNYIQKSNEIFVNFIILIFPASVFILPHGTSAPSIILSAVGLISVFLIKYNYKLSNYQRMVIFIILIYYALTLISFSVHEWNYLGWKKIGRYAKILCFIPITFLFLKIRFKPSFIWYGIVFGAICSGTYALYQGFVAGWPSDFRASGAVFPIHYGNFSILLAFFSLAAFWFFDTAYSRKFGLALSSIGFTLGMVGCILSGTRGALIAFPALILIFIYFYNTFYKCNKKSVIVIFMFLLFLIGLLGMHTGIADRLKSIKYEVNDYISKDTVNEHTPVALRLEMWRGSIEIIKDNLLFGVGAGNYKKEINKQISQNKLNKAISPYDTPHNTYILVLVSRGLIGFFSLTMLLVVPLVFFIKIVKENSFCSSYALAGIFLVVGYMHFALTESMLDRSHPINFFVIFLSVFMGVANQIIQDKSYQK